MTFIFWETFDSKMTFEKHICSVSRAASQRLGILRSPGEYSMLYCFLGNAFGVLSCPFWRTVLQCGARLQIHTLKLLDRVVSGASFLTWGVFECGIAHRRSMSVLCMLYRSFVTRCTVFMVLYLGRNCHCELHWVLWSHIGTLKLLLARSLLA